MVRFDAYNALSPFRSASNTTPNRIRGPDSAGFFWRRFPKAHDPFDFFSFFLAIDRRVRLGVTHRELRSYLRRWWLTGRQTVPRSLVLGWWLDTLEATMREYRVSLPVNKFVLGDGCISDALSFVPFPVS